MLSAYMSPRSASRELTVLLFGYSGYLGSNLYTHLTEAGFSVIPVTRNSASMISQTKSLTYDQLERHGLPDCDFVINAVGESLMDGEWNDLKKHLIEASRLQVSEQIAQWIRKSTCKPYAFISASCSSYYPPSDTTVYDETFTIPPKPTVEELKDPQVQAREMSLPYLTRMTREWEESCRVYFPETDYRTEEQKEFLRQQQKIYDPAEKTGLFDKHNPTARDLQRSSDRHNVLNNVDIRVVNLRMGTLLSRDCPASRIADPWLGWGVLGHACSGEQIMPWVHVDDACRMFIHAMVQSQHHGPMNCVAPTPTTSKQVFQYLAKSKHVHLMPFSISEDAIVSKFGPVRANVVTKSRLIDPVVALNDEFHFNYTNIDEAMQNGLMSKYEVNARSVGGYHKLSRHAVFKPKYH